MADAVAKLAGLALGRTILASNDAVSEADEGMILKFFSEVSIAIDFPNDLPTNMLVGFMIGPGGSLTINPGGEITVKGYNTFPSLLTPKSAKLPGLAVFMCTGTQNEYVELVGEITANSAPTAAPVLVGDASEGATLSVNVNYADDDGDPAGVHLYQWVIYNDDGGSPDLASEEAIDGQTDATYTIQAGNIGKHIACKVTPVATSGASPGAIATSNKKLAGVAQLETIFAFGNANDDFSGGKYHNRSNAYRITDTPSPVALLDINQVDRTHKIAILEDFSSSQPSGGIEKQVGDFLTAACKGRVFNQPGETGGARLSGLDPAKTYNFEILCARQTTLEFDTLVTLEGATTVSDSIDATGGDGTGNEVLINLSVQPNGSGFIDIILAGVEANDYSVLNAFKYTWT